MLVFFILVSFQSFVVLAHGDEPRLEISSDRMNPGGVIEVRGVDFEFEELVVFSLISPELEIPLGEVTADTEGIFLQIVMLPVDLKEGAYHFRAITDDHEILSPALFIQGPVMDQEGEGQGQRDSADLLPVPMPTFATAVIPVVPSETSRMKPPATDTSVMDSSAILLFSLVLLLGFAILLILKRRNP